MSSLSTTDAKKARKRKKKALICKLSPTGVWEVDKAKLQAVVETHGLVFVDATALHYDSLCKLDVGDFDVTKAAVFLLNKSHVRIPYSPHNTVAYIGRGQIPNGVYDCGSIGIRKGSSKWEVAKFISEGADKTCVVCYKATGTPLADQCIMCFCGTGVCFDCHIDLLLISDKEMIVECPNCRCETSAIENFGLILSGVVGTKMNRNDDFGEMTEEHFAFIEKITGIDIRLPSERVLAETKVICAFYNKALEKAKSKRDTDEFTFLGSLEIDSGVYADVRQFVARMRKKKVASASAEGSVRSAVVARRGCANCAKQFWDKSEWRRAPKCGKCQRTAYCSAKCRKAHAKAHTAECSGTKGAKRKRKAKKKKPKKGGCAPY